MPLFATYNTERQRGAWYEVERLDAAGKPRICDDQTLEHPHMLRGPQPLQHVAALEPGQRVVVAWREAGATHDSYWEGRITSAPVSTAAETRKACAFANRAYHAGELLRTVRVRWMHDFDDNTVDVSRVYASIGGREIEATWPNGPGRNPQF